MARQLYVVRINEPYDVKLLETTARRATEPFTGLYELESVHSEVWMDRRWKIGPDGIPPWALSLVQSDLERDFTSGFLLGVTPYLLPSYGGLVAAVGKGRTTFISTGMHYLNPCDTGTFLRYAPKIVAHELGEISGLEHHEHDTNDLENPALMRDGIFCLMNMIPGPDIMHLVDKYDMMFCRDCTERLKEQK